MALTIFLFKVSDLDIGNTKSDILTTKLGQSTQSLSDDNALLLCAKITFRGNSLWSNNVPIQNGTASFLAHGQKPKKIHFTLGSVLVPDDKVLIEFFSITRDKKRKKVVAVFQLILESLIDTKYVDLPAEHLSDSNNVLLKSTVQLKLYYTPPSFGAAAGALGFDDESGVIDYASKFDEEDRHGGHRRRHIHSKHDSGFKKLRSKVMGSRDDADSDSYSDSDFDAQEKLEQNEALMTEEEKQKVQYSNIEILEKSLGRYEGDMYQKNEWQIMTHVIQARNLPGLDINPYVCVQIDDQKRYTAIKKTSNSPFYGELFTFDVSAPASQMMEKVLFFKVHHAAKIISAFTHTKPIGIFKVDISTLYNEKEHAFERRWAKVSDPDSVQSGNGEILLSIAVAERGAPLKNILGEVIEGEDDANSAKAFIPAAMPRNLLPVQLKMTFFAAQELPAMMTDFMTNLSKKVFQSDTWEPIDSYVQITYNGVHGTTEPRNGSSPVWEEALYLNGQFPALIRTIRVSLKDHSTLQQDRIISAFLIDLFSISEVNVSNPAASFLPTFGPTWVFLYGSPREYTMSTDQDGLGEGLGEAVCYKGRLFMEIDCHPISGENASSTDVQKQVGVSLPESHILPMKRTFTLFGCIYEVAMIDNMYSKQTILFELSIGSSGYSTPNQLSNPTGLTSVTVPYPTVSLKNNKRHFRLPIDLLKPIMTTKYTFYDYSYRMTVSNRLKRAAEHMSKLVRDFELVISSKATEDILQLEFFKIESYIRTLPCGCGDKNSVEESFGMTGTVHPTLSELLNVTHATLRLNALDEKRRKKIVQNLASLKGWISRKVELDETKLTETVRDLNKIVRVLRQLAYDVQPSLPDIFLWMVCDSKRVAYARIHPEDVLFSICEGDKGLYNGHVQTLFLRTPQTANKAAKSSTNAKVQIFLWLGTEEQERAIYKQLPPGFEMPTLPLTDDVRHMRYNKRTVYELRCHCYTARSLIALDDTGLSDPYLSITAGSSTQTTPILIQSLCPQWNLTLCFPNLMHVGNRETAEEIIGNVVVECYDYDEDSKNSPELLGRFSTTAKLDLFNEDKVYKKPVFQWYELKLGEKRAGEILAAFELIEINPENVQKSLPCELEEIPVTPQNFPSKRYITKYMENRIYHIPDKIMPELKPYEIQIMFWGLRECRSIKGLPIQSAKVSIECASERLENEIKDVQNYPNFKPKDGTSDIYKLTVYLPEDSSFWPHLSISCVEMRLFRISEVVGNLVVTNLQRFIERPHEHLKSKDELEDEMSGILHPGQYNFNRVRRSITDAYEAVVANNDEDIGKQKLDKFEQQAGRIALNKSASINENDDEAAILGSVGKTSMEEQPLTTVTTTQQQSSVVDPRQAIERAKMEKEANWWSKYYASKAKLVLARKQRREQEEELEFKNELRADLFEEDSRIVVKSRKSFWSKTKKVWLRTEKVRKGFKTRVINEIENLDDDYKTKLDERLENIDRDHLKELTLLQTFDVFEKELENVDFYEGFNDALDTFPLYKGKGTSRSDERGDEKRVYAKFKGKFRIRELTTDDIFHEDVSKINKDSDEPQQGIKETNAHAIMRQFDLNANPIAFKCRLYVVKANLFRSWDRSGKADPYIKVLLNDNVIVDDVNSHIKNTLEPVFGKCYEFQCIIPQQSLLRIQVWDWDLASVNDKIAETSIDIENRWFSCHRATCGLPRRYDSAGYNAWRDTKKPSTILERQCVQSGLNVPLYTEDNHSLAIGAKSFMCDPECIEFVTNGTANTMAYRKVHHETKDEYIKQNTALAALHSWGREIDRKGALLSEHIECRSLINPEYPDIIQGTLEMWLDFFPMSRPPSSAPIDITPPEPKAYELRLTVFNTTDVELNDENILTGERTSDIYVKAWILGENEDAQETDVHYRSLTGEGNFNWRLIYKFNYLDIERKIIYDKKSSVFQIGAIKEKIPPRIVIRVYDSDLISADDFLGECILNLARFPIGAKTSRRCKAGVLKSSHPHTNLFERRRITGWWPMLAARAPGSTLADDALGGKLEAEFVILPADEAEQNQAGKGREAPQPLEPPNRPKTSFLWFTSPLKTCQYVIWRNFKGPICLGVILFIFVIFLLLALWSIPGEVVKQTSNKIFRNNGGS